MGSFQIDFGGLPGTGPAKSHIVGIDLGTTNSLIAYMGPTHPEIIAGADGDALVPSVVTIEDGLPIVGKDAQAALMTHPADTIYSVKRLMGRGVADVQDELKLFPFRIAPDSDSVIRLDLGGKTFTAPEISAMILRQLKNNAEDHLGTPVTQAVITVPAYFNEVLRLVNEPTAAALAYGLDKRKQGTIAVYDLGGGTFDISILKLHDGIFEVLATGGDTHLGGDDFDNLLMQVALEDLASEWGAPVTDPIAVQTLRRIVIDAKHALSVAPSVTFTFHWNGHSYGRQLTREVFEKLITPVVDRTLGPCRQAMKDAGVTPEQIDEVVLVGGSTRIPMVRSAVETLFRAKPHTELDPDKVVALGAAVQAGILSGQVDDQLLLDVTPLSLGIETMGGLVSRIIGRNSTIPASATESFTTGVDGQTNVLIHVVQGERELVKDCRSLARFDLKGIAPMQAGMARISVKFLIDANGILQVSAKDDRTGVEQSFEVKPSYGLTDEQVEAMVEESIDNAEADFHARQVREAQVEADQVMQALDKARRSQAFTELSDSDRDAIDRALNELLVVYHGQDHLLLRRKIEALDKASRGLAENMMNSAINVALKGTKI
jgi:Fe-S protein assembly chaperone HscA